MGRCERQGRVRCPHGSRRQEAAPLISLLVYGRNDQHGYNSHRRVALSLNAMAEVLTGPDDEILFVDYHTPHGMPTLPEAIDDTLTDRAISLMRVFRVTPEMHMAAVGDRSRLPISEPHARNTAIRRARPGNWILSTNTDMVFVPRGEKSLTDLVADLDGDAYCLPRFEIPEWLWEAVPRDDPGQMISLLHDWGERTGLDEVTLGHDWILYDAPGDFQLVRRELMEEVHGFDEDMIHGWHVDSNLWKRIYNRTGHIGTLYPDIAGYHTNHNRTLTRLMAAQPTGNDLAHFVYEVDHSSLPAQAETWGFANEDVHEVPLRRTDPLPLLTASAARGPGQAGPLITSDTREQMTVLTYDARHILPFALDPVIAEVPRPSMGYVGMNPSTAGMLAAAAEALGCPGPLLEGPEAARSAGVVVLDLGIDASARSEAAVRDGAPELVATMRQAVELLRQRDPSPIILIINAISGIWEPWVRAQFNLSYGTFHTRIQPAELKAEVPEGAIDAFVLHSLLFATRNRAGIATAIREGDDEVVRLATGADYAGLDEGWESVDEVGAYVGSGEARLAFTSTAPVDGLVRVSVDLSCWSSASTPRDNVEVDITIDDAPVFAGQLAAVPQLTTIRNDMRIGPGTTHELVIRTRTADGVPYAPRQSGGAQPWIRVGGVRIAPAEALPLPVGEWAPVHPGSAAEALLRGRWTATNPFGAWSVGGGSLEITPADASTVEVEVLGHAERPGGRIRVVASGATRLEDEVDVADHEVPGHVTIALPAPDPAGNVRIDFVALDPAAPSGEVIEVRAVRLPGGV